VFEVAAFDNDRVEPVPEADLLHWDHRLDRGIGRHDGEFVTLLDLERLFLACPAVAPGSPAAPPFAGADPDAVLAPFWLLYSMESEREMHRDFCRRLGLAEPDEVSAGPPEVLDIFF